MSRGKLKFSPGTLSSLTRLSRSTLKSICFYILDFTDKGSDVVFRNYRTSRSTEDIKKKFFYYCYYSSIVIVEQTSKSFIRDIGYPKGM